MKITRVELDAVHVNHLGDWVFVHIFTDEGIQGLGELRAGKNYTNAVAAVRQLGDQLTGEDPLQIEPIFSIELRSRMLFSHICIILKFIVKRLSFY